MLRTENYSQEILQDDILRFFFIVGFAVVRLFLLLGVVMGQNLYSLIFT